MLALVRAQVDAGKDRLEQGEHRLPEGLGVADGGEDAAVVVLIRLDVEYPYAWSAAERRRRRVDDVAAPAFADVGDALDQPHSAFTITTLPHSGEILLEPAPAFADNPRQRE